jgi:Domain of unknown function (DUF5134)
LMSSAMIAMTWAFSGGPDTGSGILQIVVFGLIGLWFLTRAAGHGHGHGRIESAYHLVMAAAMVWMVAAMPVLMSGSGDVMNMSAPNDTHGDHGSMAGMDGMAGMHATNGSTGMPGMSAMVGPPSWVRMVSYALLVLLVGAMALWASRLFRPAILRPTPSEVQAPDSAVPSAGAAVAVRPRASGLTQLTPRLDAGCHLLMSLGMAGALLAML